MFEIFNLNILLHTNFAEKYVPPHKRNQPEQPAAAAPATAPHKEDSNRYGNSSNAPRQYERRAPSKDTLNVDRKRFWAPRNEDVERRLFASTSTGINFEKYDDIPVTVTGKDCPEPIKSVFPI